MKDYEHTQRSRLFGGVVALIVGIFIFIFWENGFDILLGAFMVLILAIIASFSFLTVSLDDSYLRVKFGWGIRVWFWPYMIIYNTSGFDAIEIVMRNKKIYRIGTDDVETLENKVQEKIAS